MPGFFCNATPKQTRADHHRLIGLRPSGGLLRTYRLKGL
jgi:hypothetical protein